MISKSNVIHGRPGYLSELATALGLIEKFTSELSPNISTALKVSLVLFFGCYRTCLKSSRVMSFVSANTKSSLLRFDAGAYDPHFVHSLPFLRHCPILSLFTLLSLPLPAFQHEMCDCLSTAAAPPATCVLNLFDPHQVNACDKQGPT